MKGILYTIYRRDRDWAGTDKRKKGGVAVYVRENLKVLNVNREFSFEMLSVELLLPSGHHMLIIGLYDPLSFQDDEGDVIDPINTSDSWVKIFLYISLKMM